MNNKPETPPIKPGDLTAIRNTHAQLHALLVFICSNNFKSLQRISPQEQQDLLLLARATSENLREYLG
ncbi:hypothetical protein [Allopusillimonas ginsengisoli]|uniref:hypothetical protein n=1 Tax=Allopusillimonas ginsengisoli TaxID=453575 RepID=UPI001021BE1A|nr:hypothetical protein [Allopusillimonas ginsengisoli]TEA78669.1 hypothetical protein ERE07_09750 [Allopusillimonas ginsengisoli]